MSILENISAQLDTVIKQQTIYITQTEQLKKDVAYLSSAVMTLTSLVQSINAKCNDTTLTVDRLDDMTQEVAEDVSTLITNLQQVSEEIKNVQIYTLPPNYFGGN